MKGFSEVIPFMILFVILIATAFSIHTSMFNTIGRMGAGLGTWGSRFALERSITYNAVCENNGNTIKLTHTGAVEDYFVRLICIDANRFCVVPTLDGNYYVFQYNPGNSLDYNILSCGKTFVVDCNTLRCLVVGTRGFVPVSPK